MRASWLHLFCIRVLRKIIESAQQFSKARELVRSCAFAFLPKQAVLLKKKGISVSTQVTGFWFVNVQPPMMIWGSFFWRPRTWASRAACLRWRWQAFTLCTGKQFTLLSTTPWSTFAWAPGSALYSFTSHSLVAVVCKLAALKGQVYHVEVYFAHLCVLRFQQITYPDIENPQKLQWVHYHLA